MSDIAEALVEAVADACGRHPSTTVVRDGSQWNARLWAALDQIGITLLSVPEELGGSGGDLGLAGAVLQTLGEHAAEVPFAETAVLAGWLLGECHAPIPGGPMTAAVVGPDVDVTDEDDGLRLHGQTSRVAWGRHVEHVVLLAGRRVIVVSSEEFQILPGTNLAGEARDDIVFDRLRIPANRCFVLPESSSIDAEHFAARGAVARLQLIAGAARRALQMSVAYASERHQFGRPIDGFQSVQHELATIAGEALLCKAAADAAASTLDEGNAWRLPVAAAKLSAGTAGSSVARLAHQIHGAIGFTEEHDLRLTTSRIWSWRDEFGSPHDLATRVGSLVTAVGPDDLWPLLTDD